MHSGSLIPAAGFRLGCKLPPLCPLKAENTVNVPVGHRLPPFQCWSLWDYGILDRSADERTITGIDSAKDAGALLSILDKTVSAEDAAIIPNGLDKALKHIASKSPRLESDIRFQRLLTLSRR